jgi:hypothetical protein
MTHRKETQLVPVLVTLVLGMALDLWAATAACAAAVPALAWGLCQPRPKIADKARALRKRLQRHDLSTISTPTRIVLDYLCIGEFRRGISQDQMPFLTYRLPPESTPVMRKADRLVAIFRNGRFDQPSVMRALCELESSVKSRFRS